MSCDHAPIPEDDRRLVVQCSKCGGKTILARDDPDPIEELRAWARGERGGLAFPKMPDPLPDGILPNSAYLDSKPSGHWFPIWADDGKMYWFKSEPVQPSWRERLYGSPDARVFIEERGLAVYVPPEAH